MTYRMYGALVASLSALALMLPVNETFAGTGTALRGGFVSAHSISRPSIARAFRHHRRNDAGAFWPGAGDYPYGTSNGEPLANVTPPTSGDVRYTTTYDVPWDWAHRFPPIVTPSDRPYVTSCPTESATVPGNDGQSQTVYVMRCY
jgi:outer membrane PBP1 activator LpoA protein